MNSFLACTHCMIRQSLEVLNKHCPDQHRQEAILKNIFQTLSQSDILESSPPQLTAAVHSIITRELGIDDLYAEEKARNNEEALEIEPLGLELIAGSADPLLTAVKLAGAGNIIDYGALTAFDIRETIDRIVHQDFAINYFEDLLQLLERSRTILYIGDNAGEIVFDKVLIKLLVEHGHKVLFAVKSSPVLNDVLMKDAQHVGMDKLVPVLESGSTTAGTLPGEMAADFREWYVRADGIIAKGLGNFETLYGLGDRANKFFLFTVKCPHIAHYLKLDLKDLVLLKE